MVGVVSGRILPVLVYTLPYTSAHTAHFIRYIRSFTTIRALFSTVSPLSSHEVDGVRKEKERLTDGSDRGGDGVSP